MKIEYPKALYHAIHPVRIVHSREEHEALGSGWHEAPLPSAADFDEVYTRRLAVAESEDSSPGHPELQPRVDNFKKRRK